MDIKLKPWGLVPATSMGGWWCVCLCGGWVPCGIEAQREVQRSLGPRRTGNDRPGQELQLPHLLAVATRCRLPPPLPTPPLLLLLLLCISLAEALLSPRGCLAAPHAARSL